MMEPTKPQPILVRSRAFKEEKEEPADASGVVPRSRFTPPTTPTSTKRRRLESPGKLRGVVDITALSSLSTTPGSSTCPSELGDDSCMDVDANDILEILGCVKDEEDDEEDASSVGGSSTSAQRRKRVKPPCPGCGRYYQVDTEWNKDGPVVWALPKGRGAWCKLCFTSWRDCYRPLGQLLPSFPQWIQKNGTTWMFTLVAVATLMEEGSLKIDLDNVKTRIEIVKFIMRMTGHQLRAQVAVRLQALMSGAARMEVPTAIDPSTLITMMSSEGSPHLGVLMPAPASERALPGRMQLPSVTRGRPFLERGFVNTTCQEDLATLSNMYDCVQTLDSSLVEPPTDALAIPSISKMQMKVNGYIDLAKAQVEIFSKADWADTVKESNFTTPATKLASVVAEADSIGDSEASQTAKKYSVGTTLTKTYCKEHRDYVKTGRKHERLIKITETVLSHRPFLLMAGVAPAVSYELLWHKAQFWYSIEVSLISVKDAFEVSHQAGLANVFARMVAGSQPLAIEDANHDKEGSAPAGRGKYKVKKEQLSPCPYLSALLFPAFGRSLAATFSDCTEDG